MGIVIALAVLTGSVLFVIFAPHHWKFQQPSEPPESVGQFHEFLRRIRAAIGGGIE